MLVPPSRTPFQVVQFGSSSRPNTEQCWVLGATHQYTDIDWSRTAGCGCVTRDFYSTLLHSRPPHSLSSHKAFQRFRLGTFHFQMLSLLFHLDSVLQEFSFCRARGKGWEESYKTHTHATRLQGKTTLCLIRLGSSDLRGWVPSRFLFLFLFLKPESKLASSSRSSRFHAGSLLTCSCCWLVYASPLERPFVF